MFKTVKADKISESTSQQIREAIFEDSLRPGDKLPSERELIKTFDVSRASMREALRSLEVLGFLEIRKGISGGAFVTEIEFHRIIGNACCNPLLSFIVDSVHHLIADVKDILQPSFGFSMKALKTHQKIYKALEARNAENSRREMFQHLSEVEKDLALLQKQKRFRVHVLSMGHGFGLKKEVVSTKGIIKVHGKGGHVFE